MMIRCTNEKCENNYWHFRQENYPLDFVKYNNDETRSALNINDEISECNRIDTSKE